MPPLLANLQMGGWEVPKTAIPLDCYIAKPAWEKNEEGGIEGTVRLPGG